MSSQSRQVASQFGLILARRRLFYAGCCALAIAVLPSLAAAQLSPEIACEDAIQGYGELPEKLAGLARTYLGSSRWSREDRERLCRGTRAPHEPPTCFANAIESEEPWTSGKTARWELAIDLCAGTNDARSTFNCFQKSKEGGRPGEFTRIDRWQNAVKACSRRVSATPGGQVGAPTAGPGQVTAPAPAGGGVDPEKEAMQEEIERLKKELEEKSKAKVVIPQELADDVEALKKQTFQKTEPNFQQFGSLASGKVSAPFQLSIDKDGTYSVVALCGKDCKEVELALHDENNNQLGGTPLGTKDKPVVGFKAKKGSKFSVNLLMKSCAKSPCPFGIILLEEAADAVASVQLFQTKSSSPATPGPKPPGPPTPAPPGSPTPGPATPGPPGSPTPGPPGPATPKPAKLPPEACADFLENHVDFSYADSKWPASGTEVRQMCQGVPNALEPPRCYYRMMHETGPPEGRSDWGPPFAVKLCAKTTNADDRVDCFNLEVAKEKAYRPIRRKDRAQLAAGPARWSHAINLCIRRNATPVAPRTRTASEAMAYAKPGFAEVEKCLKAVQGKIPFGFRGPTTWDLEKLETLCRGTSRGDEPKDCFVSAISSGVLNTHFNADGAVTLCAGTNAAKKRVSCLKGESQAMSPTGTQSGLNSAIARCARD